MGELPDTPIEEGVRATIEHFDSALRAGVLTAGAQVVTPVHSARTFPGFGGGQSADTQ